MDKLPVISWKKPVKALEKEGFKVDRQKGSHLVLINEAQKRRITVPKYKEIPKETLRAILRQTGIERRKFIEKPFI